LIFGEGNITEGEIRLKGKRIKPKIPAQAVRYGLALVPEERRKEGILVYESVETNITLPTLEKYCKGIFMQKNKIKQVSRELIKQVAIKTPSEKQLVAYLSGGNQQKVAVGKWFLSDAEVFILDEVTKGVDVGSKVEIYELIGGLVHQGTGALYASCEFGEILGLTDRIYVMYNGTIVKELVTKDTTEEELLYYAAGGGLGE
jgi:simple sugar transport system ATP-binding protein